MIAHYHWQVGLVADGRLLAAAAAASSDTVRGLACFARVSLTPPPSHPSHTCRRQEDLRVQAGSCGTEGRPPLSGSWCGPQARPGREPGRLSHFLPFLLPSPPAHPLNLSCFPIEIGRAWVTPGGFPTAGAGRGVGGRDPPPQALRPPPLSRGSEHRRAAVCPSLPLFLKCLQIQKRFRNAFRLREPEDLG